MWKHWVWKTFILFLGLHHTPWKRRRRYKFTLKGIKCEDLLLLWTCLWWWWGWVYFQNIQAISKFFSPGPASLMSCPYASPFLFDRCTDGGESWEDVMAFCREEGSYIQYYHFASPSLLFYKTLPESYGANESRVVYTRLYFVICPILTWSSLTVQRTEGSVES